VRKKSREESSEWIVMHPSIEPEGRGGPVTNFDPGAVSKKRKARVNILPDNRVGTRSVA
jgi:hypothetical protein